MIEVCLVDDQTLVRQGIRALLDLTSDIRVTGEAADGAQALQVITESPPDVLLLDLRLPKLNGVEVLRELQRRQASVPALLITTFDDDLALLDGVRAGARGYLLKDVTLEYLASAIRTVAAGGSLVQPALTERLTRELQNAGSPPAPKDDLTSRETEILRLLSGGFSNREIATALRVAEGTVKNHVSAILSKLGVRDRTRAVLKAIQEGII
jgi:DNA-binding NarL/FixJ family response regulator